MKVGLITILDNINFGTILQAYALANKIESFGHKVCFINYWRPNSSIRCQIRGILNDKKRSLVRRVVYAVSALFLVPFIKLRLRSFLTARFRFTRKYRSIESLRKHPPQADIYMTGSDQVWNSRYNNGVDRAFFLDFTESPKISYAASMGIDNFPPDEVTEVVSLLKRYRSISVRENQTVRYMLDLGLSFVTQDLDPTLLLTAEDWKKIIRYRSKSQPQYLLVYSVEGNNNDFIFQQASIIAREKGLKLYAVTAADPFKLKKYNCDKIYAFAGVEHFVTLLADAAFVVASSFHGTAFSINFNKEFVTVAPRRYNIRLKSLAQQLEVSHRIITSHEVCICDLQPLDYEFINEKLNICRMVSEDRLRSFLF